MIVRCQTPDDVVASVNFAPRATASLLAVRGGGHNVAGNATCDGGLVIDLSPMKGVTVDPWRSTAGPRRAAPGRELDRATQAFGLATTGGLVSTTGIAGFTLGGGIGWLMRKYGLACDNLLSVDLVTADGQPSRASATENPDLFWGAARRRRQLRRRDRLRRTTCTRSARCWADWCCIRPVARPKCCGSFATLWPRHRTSSPVWRRS